jgi:hypothetical protein
MSRAKKKGKRETLNTTRRMDSRSETAGVPAPLNATNRVVMIAEAAYFLAEQRQFTPGYQLDDWLAAERQIDALFRRNFLPSSN